MNLLSSELQHGGWHRLVPVLFWCLLQSSCCMLHCCSASCMGAESRLQVKNVQSHEVTCPIAWGDSHGKLLSELWPSRLWRSWKLGLESVTLHGWRGPLFEMQTTTEKCMFDHFCICSVNLLCGRHPGNFKRVFQRSHLIAIVSSTLLQRVGTTVAGHSWSSDYGDI